MRALNKGVMSFPCSFNIFIEHLGCARYWSRYWCYKNKQSLSLHQVMTSAMKKDVRFGG